MQRQVRQRLRPPPTFSIGCEVAARFVLSSTNEITNDCFGCWGRRPIAALAPFLTDAKLKTRLADLGYATSGSSPAEFGSMIAREIEKWAKVLKFAGLKPD